MNGFDNGFGLFDEPGESVAARPSGDSPDVGVPLPARTDDEIEVAPGQATLFGDNGDFHLAWREWQDMPEYSHEDLQPWRTVFVHFATREDWLAFAELVGQRLTPKTRSIWYPSLEIRHFSDKRYVAVDDG